MLAALLACTEPTVFPPDTAQLESELTITVSRSEVVSSVVSVSVAETADFTVSAVAESTAISAAAEEGVATLLGLKASTTYDLTVTVDNSEHDAGTITTGAPPPHLPEMTLTAGAALSGFLVTSILSTPSAAVILDADGDYVWWMEASNEGLITRSRLSRDGTSLIFLDPVALDGQQTTYALRRVSLDGTSDETLPAESIHHDFIEVEDGVFAQIQHDTRTVDGETVQGDRLVEVHADGTEVEIWSVWDHLTYHPDQSQAYYDWTHANALDYDEDAGAYTISICAFSTIFHIDRETGSTLWRLGGDESDFRGAAADLEPFVHQHQFQLTQDGILVFDNQALASQESRVVEYALEEDTGTLSLLWRYVPDPSFYTHGLGDVHRLPSGNTRIVWSAQGQIDEVTPTGELVWQMNASLGGGIGYVDWIEAL